MYEYAISRLIKLSGNTEQEITKFVKINFITYFELLRFYIFLYRFPTQKECREIAKGSEGEAVRVAIKALKTQ